MKPKRHSYEDLKKEKDRMKYLIREQEMKIRFGVKDLVTSLTPRQVKSDIVNYLVSNPQVAFKAGYLLFSLLAGRRAGKKSRRKKGSPN